MTIKLKVEFLKPKKSKKEIEKQRKLEEEKKRVERIRIRNEKKAKAKLSREQHIAWRKIKRDYGNKTS